MVIAGDCMCYYCAGDNDERVAGMGGCPGARGSRSRGCEQARKVQDEFANGIACVALGGENRYVE